MDVYMDASLLYKKYGGWQSGKFRPTNEYKLYHHDMVEAGIHFRLDYTSLLYIYKLIKHIPMQ